MTDGNDSKNPTGPTLEPAEERRLAAGLFNHTWDLLGLDSRTTEQDDAMIHAAHASRWHWGNIGGPTELAVGEWQCSRVYAVLGYGEASLRHAKRCLQLCEGNEVAAYAPASAHEAVARAYAVLGDRESAIRHRDLAVGLAAGLDDAEDRAIVDADIATLPID